MMLGDLGAKIIKVESPQGDRLRHFGGKGENPYFSVLNRGKKIIVLDLKTDKGKAGLAHLLKKADVLITGVRPGKASGLGLSWPEVRKKNKRIVHCSITGYGTRGEGSKKAGHDLNYLAQSGSLAILSQTPKVPSVQHADLVSGSLACTAIIGALLSRCRDGKGRFLDLGMADASSYFFGMYLAHEALRGKDGYLCGEYPCYNVYEAKDGKWVALGAVEGKFWESWCNAAAEPGLIGEQWSVKGTTLQKVKEIFKKKTAREWASLNDRHDFCCEEIVSAKEAVRRGVTSKKWKRIKDVPFPSLPLGLRHA